MAVAFSDLITVPTASQIKARVVAIAQAAGLAVTAWVLGSPSERWLEIVSRAIDAFFSGPTTAAVRMMFLDLSTDPGDAGDLSTDQTPRAGFLSALGEGWYGTTRGGATYATTLVRVQNTGTIPATFSAYDLTFTLDATTPARSDGGKPTYRNTTDATIYTGLGDTLTLAPGADAWLPVQCEQVGTYGTANAGVPSTSGAITVCVTQSFGTLTVMSANAAIGADREDRWLYVARCRQASTAASPHGAGDAYRYAATTGRDGSALARHDGSGTVGITEAYVSKDSSTGTVACYFRDPDGPADAVDVASANANIQGVVLGSITDPIGVVPDGITYSGAAATATSITITGTAKIKAIPGVDSVTLKANAEAAILAYLSGTSFPAIPIGGVDQVAGAGVVYTSDLADDTRNAYAGLYAVSLSSPATSTTAIALGHVATLNGSSAVTVTVVA